ncbi:transcriptional regulator, TetR family [Aeromicrobium marinum DSM 15272]|uniref:Transcriptional regulator, TetR family n=1 Tax=Aeromicrobium marinum DSM 15272 TaxID=585531 RepID=E2SCI4_9ACTN|nr:TetR/AcrR family transcriptional regulator [Aeromicrobium marinum]EFQ82937.1 transcriptional regulator, TetR family [Aeromicrobium marinum DSM 15272]
MVSRSSQRRSTLSRDAIVDAAVRVADRGGLVDVSMRNVGAELGATAMALYHHVANKDEVLDALANWVFTRIELPSGTGPWRPAMAARAASARAELSAHPWALGLIESRRAPGPDMLRHHDAVLGCLRAGGFGVGLAAHAFSAIDAYVYGFVLTEVNLPFEAGEQAEEFIGTIRDLIPADRYPHLVEMVTDQVVGGGYDYGDEFGFGLDLVLDGLEARLATQH